MHIFQSNIFYWIDIYLDDLKDMSAKWDMTKNDDYEINIDEEKSKILARGSFPDN